MAKEKEEEPEKPVVDTFEMTSLKATKANELTATFASAVASTAAIDIKVSKVGSTNTITGTTKWSEDGTSVVFTAAANFLVGTYEMTATDAADTTKTTSKTAEVEAERVDQIVIKGTTALTNADKTKAYVYYDVLNQYEESIRTSTSINWTVSTGKEPKIDKAVGKLTIEKGDGTEFTYGSMLYVTGVYNKTGKTVQEQLTIGMEQSLDTVKTAGFVKLTNKNEIIKSLPTNFQKGQYLMAFEVLDQNENPMDVTGIEVGKDVTFISDNVLLITNDFKDPGEIAEIGFSTLTIAGTEYGVVTVEPGQYVDKGGEVNITAISNKTGKKTPMNYLIGAAAILKSVILRQPEVIVADGETATIPYDAYDTEDNKITNYESIARSTNSINLTAGEGTLVLKEANDGTAEFVWTDKGVAWTDSCTKDDIDRSVALATVVVGGESNNLILSVSDKARPVAISDVVLRSNATTAIVSEDHDSLDFTTDFKFVDQYNRAMSSDNGFFATACDGWNNEYYAVKVAFNKTASSFSLDKTATEGAILLTTAGSTITNKAGNTVNWKAADVSEVVNETVKYSVVSNKSKDKDVTDFDNVGKELRIAYSIVPMEKVSSISIDALNKQYINIGLGEYKTAAEAKFVANDLTVSLGALNSTTSGAAVDLTDNKMIDTNHEQTIGLSGYFGTVKVVIPSEYVKYSAGKFDLVSNKITGGAVSTTAIKLGDFYNAKEANLTRKDGTDTIKAEVYTVTSGAIASFGGIDYQHAAPTAPLTFSDAMPAPTTVNVCGESCTANPTNTDLKGTAFTDHGPLHGAITVSDQYGKPISASDYDLVYNVAEITENAGEFAHLDNSFVVNSNDTNSTWITGAELGDKYTLTVTAYNKYGSAKGAIKFTVGADAEAFISTAAAPTGGDHDKDFRKDFLHYAY